MTDSQTAQHAQSISNPGATSTSGSRTLIVAGLVIVAGVITIAVGLRGGDSTGRVNVLSAEFALLVPEFSLIESSGRKVSRDDLLGKVWVADFIFSRCSGPCPTLSQNMHLFELALEGEPDARFVTLTLDPANDTPEVLADYARRFHADPQRWLFLTGDDQPAIHQLVEKGFLQAVKAATADAPIVHSTYFVLVDRAGRMRGFFDGLDAESRSRVPAAVRALLAEPRPQ